MQAEPALLERRWRSLEPIQKGCFGSPCSCQTGRRQSSTAALAFSSMVWQVKLCVCGAWQLLLLLLRPVVPTTCR